MKYEEFLFLRSAVWVTYSVLREVLEMNVTGWLPAKPPCSRTNGSTGRPLGPSQVSSLLRLELQSSPLSRINPTPQSSTPGSVTTPITR